jgi:hypothetical protein
MKTGMLLVAPALVAGSVAAGEDVFLSSPPYDILVTLEYSDPADPYGSQGYIESYRSTSMFSHVVFGPSFSPEFPAMFSSATGPSGAGGVIPSIQESGSGVIEQFTLQPAWESDDEPIEGRVTHGPGPFDPTLTLITLDMAMEAQESGSEDDMAIVPLVPTLWLLFNEGFSVAEPELQWEYPEFAINSIGSGAVLFSVPLSDLGPGMSFELHLPYESDTAIGQWTIKFMPAE